MTAGLRAALQGLVHSEESDEYRDEACRHVVAQPYADNRYVRLLDDLRALLAAHPEPEPEHPALTSLREQVARAVEHGYTEGDVNDNVQPIIGTLRLLISRADVLVLDRDYAHHMVERLYAACDAETAWLNTPLVAHQDTEREAWLHGNGKTHRQADGTIRCPANGGIAAEVDEDGPWCSACGGDVEPSAPPAVPETDEAAAMAELTTTLHAEFHDKDGCPFYPPADCPDRKRTERLAVSVLALGYRKQVDR